MSKFASLLFAAQTGEEQALNELFDTYYETVQRLVHQGLAREMRPSRPWIGALFSTGDVVQEVFMSVLRDLDGFDGDSESQFIGFLATLTRSRIVDAVRFHEAMKRDRRRVRSSMETLRATRAGDDSPLQQVASTEEIARFSRALAQFSQRERLLLRGRLEQQTPYGPLAETLGYPSADAARKAYQILHARLALKLAAIDPREDRA